MNLSVRYSKEIIEQFALKTIGLSFDKKYLDYYKPDNEDNFDYISPTNESALEIRTVFSDNEKRAYEYDIAYSKGKQKLKFSHIIGVSIKDNGELSSYYGASINEIESKIIEAIKEKEQKALKRLENKPYKTVDLCLCVEDGGFFDLKQFVFSFGEKAFDDFIFDRIFFITTMKFICFSKNKGFKEYPRIISESTD